MYLSIWCKEIESCDVQTELQCFCELSETRANWYQFISGDICSQLQDFFTKMEKMTIRLTFNLMQIHIYIRSNSLQMNRKLPQEMFMETVFKSKVNRNIK